MRTERSSAAGEVPERAIVGRRRIMESRSRRTAMSGLAERDPATPRSWNSRPMESSYARSEPRVPRWRLRRLPRLTLPTPAFREAEEQQGRRADVAPVAAEEEDARRFRRCPPTARPWTP